MNASQLTESAPTIRVAIVDDHRLILDGLRARLHNSVEGIDVVAAETSWARLIAHPAFPCDVVVLDLHLDDGIAIATKLRFFDTVGIAAVVMSRHTDATSVTSALRAGAFAFVPKTESADELEQAIRSAAARVRYLPPELAASISTYHEHPNPRLGKQEQRALTIYAAGLSVKEVAREMDTTEETVKSYIKRGRRKFRAVGVDVGTRVLLRRQGVSEGWLNPEQ
jgi:DNA-binding NarL/FixJ family response regulator